MWITISSGILGFSFIFGNSIRTVFESVLTLFVIHPFDVGDTIYIDGAYCVVEEASLNKACSNPRTLLYRPFSIDPFLSFVCVSKCAVMFSHAKHNQESR